MVKTFFCLIVILLFVSCASWFDNTEFDNRPLSQGEQQQIKNSDGTPLEWPKNYPKEGFQSHDYHKYGFDVSPNYPYVTGKTISKEDSIAHASLARGERSTLSVFIDSGYAGINYDYYYCDPDSFSRIPDFDSLTKEKQKYNLEIDGYLKEKIALCKEFEGNIEKIQELHIHSYDWKSYDFHTYIFGDKNKADVQHRLIERSFFWGQFRTTYYQAIVKKGNVRNNYKESGEYIFTRVEGDYPDDCVKGDIARLMKEIDNDVNSGKHERRVMIQLGYPIKRFWPLKAKNNGEIEICGVPGIDPNHRDVNLRLKTLVGINGCKSTSDVIYVRQSSSQGSWLLVYYDGRQEIATTKNVDPKCMVFMDNATPDKYRVEEMPVRYAAVTINTYGSNKASIIILPWLGNMTTRTAIHELGHTMGLTDVNDAHLSSTINDETMEGNLMHSSNSRKGYRLRYRGMVPLEEEEQDKKDCSNKVGGKCVELQWDCLHKKSGACLLPTLDPYLR